MTKTVNFTLTETAVKELMRIAKEEAKIENPILRIRVVPGGCSGFQYAMGFDDEITENDIVFDTNGLKVAIDEFSAPYLNGAVLDYISDFMSSGFAIKNPNATGSCGCGKSFCG
jgi:iron-sulfur cluster assembly protein